MTGYSAEWLAKEFSSMYGFTSGFRFGTKQYRCVTRNINVYGVCPSPICRTLSVSLNPAVNAVLVCSDESTDDADVSGGDTLATRHWSTCMADLISSPKSSLSASLRRNGRRRGVPTSLLRSFSDGGISTTNKPALTAGFPLLRGFHSPLSTTYFLICVISRLPFFMSTSLASGIGKRICPRFSDSPSIDMLYTSSETWAWCVRSRCRIFPETKYTNVVRHCGRELHATGCVQMSVLGGMRSSMAGGNCSSSRLCIKRSRSASGAKCLPTLWGQELPCEPQPCLQKANYVPSCIATNIAYSQVLVSNKVIARKEEKGSYRQVNQQSPNFF